MKKFDNIILIGRPASGKSELIDLLKHLPLEERISRFHIGKFVELDDFMLCICALCDGDDELEEKGLPRIHSEKTPVGYNLVRPDIRGSFVSRFNQEIIEKYMSVPKFYDDGTLFIEFARGRGDGFKKSLEQFDAAILKKAAILYIDVSFEESYRRNDARYKKSLEFSSLCHKVTDKNMYEYFIENDWFDITGEKKSGYLKFNGVELPFVTMKNEPELPPGLEIAKRYETALSELHGLYSKCRTALL